MLDDEGTDDEELLDGLVVENHSVTAYRPLKSFRQHPSKGLPSHISAARWLAHSQRKNGIQLTRKKSNSPNVTVKNRSPEVEEIQNSHEMVLASTYNTQTPFLAYRALGGLRADPFNSLPIEPRDCIPNAVDHFIQIFIPERILRPFAAVPGIEGLAKDYFQLIINDMCLFEATIAQSQASYVAQQSIRKPTKEVLHHYGKALTLLQDKLASPEKRIEDATIQCILAIMGTAFFFGDLDAHQAHLDGLWSIIRFRGGIDTLGWAGTLKQSVETITSFRSYAAKNETPASTPATNGPDLTYPKLPFPPDLCETIAKLPLGFGDLALKRNLSIQMIDLLSNIHFQSLATANGDSPPSKPDPSPRKHLYEADKCVALLKSTTMNELERMICAGTLAYIVRSYSQPAPSTRPSSVSPSPSARPTQALTPPSSTPLSSSHWSRSSTPASTASNFPVTTIYDDTLKSLISELAQYTYFTYDQEVLVWITYTFATLQDRLMQDRRDFFHHTLLRYKQSTSWVNLEKCLKRYFWNDTMLIEWHEVREDVLRSHRPQKENEIVVVKMEE